MSIDWKAIRATVAAIEAKNPARVRTMTTDPEVCPHCGGDIRGAGYLQEQKAQRARAADGLKRVFVVRTPEPDAETIGVYARREAAESALRRKVDEANETLLTTADRRFVADDIASIEEIIVEP